MLLGMIEIFPIHDTIVPMRPHTVDLNGLASGIGDKRITFTIERCHAPCFRNGHRTDTLSLPWHNIQYLSRGSCTREIAGELFRSRAGTFLWLNPQTEYRFHFSPGSALVYAWISFAAADGTPIHLSPDRTIMDRWADGGALMRALFIAAHTRNNATMQVRLMVSLLSLILSLADHRGTHTGKRTFSDNEISAIYAQLEKTTGEAVPLYPMFGLREHTFRRVFRATFGLSPRSMSVRYRMERAADDLLAIDVPVQEIMGRYGYRDPFLFSKMFKRVHGVSPQHYRKRMKR